MNGYLNYFIEANIGLVLFLAAYSLFLKNETDFKIKRIFLLIGIFTSLLFPLLHIQVHGPAIPSLSKIIPTYMLPEIIITADGLSTTGESERNIHSGWNYVQWLYCIGLLFFLVRFLMQLLDLILILTVKNSTTTTIGNLKIVALEEEKPTCSFFNVIVLGRANSLTEDEKQNIIQHESVHAKQLHSFDILLINILGIFFWFNPVLKMYKKIFVQLHEFEADARAVENRDVNEYCNLLAKVALESAGFKLANHFSNSLTLKRIEMMKKIKRRIKPWKFLMMGSAIPLAFFILSCQDQVMSEVNEIAGSSTIALDVPTEIQQKYNAVVVANPDKKYLLMETDGTMKPKVDEMKRKLESLDQNQIGHVQLITPSVKKGETVRTFAIIEYNEQVEHIGATAKLDDGIFTIVEETAMPAGGMPEFYKHIGTHLQYPTEARQKGVEGKVFIEFVVQTDGSISDMKVLKGIGEGCDEAALNALKTSPAWIPGRNKGVAVKQKMVLPISFAL